MGWNWVLQKNKFSSSEKNCFFRTCLDCFQSTLIGLQDHCATGPLPPENFAFLFSLCAGCEGLGLGWAAVAVAKNWFFGTALVKLRHNVSGSDKLFFRTPPERWMEWTLLAGIAGVKPGTTQKQFFATSKIVFGTAIVKLSDKPSFAKLFFRMPLVRSANSTSLPRFSSLRIAQMHTILSQECSKNLRDPRPIVVEICLH